MKAAARRGAAKHDGVVAFEIRDTRVLAERDLLDLLGLLEVVGVALTKRDLRRGRKCIGAATGIVLGQLDDTRRGAQ